MSRLLIVEDDAENRETLRALAQLRRFDCDTAATVAQAHERMRASHYDLIICDLLLPDGDGRELFDRLAPRDNRTELVFATGHASLDTAIDALRLGAADYLVKPFNLPRLEGILARVALRHTQRDALARMRAELERSGRFGPMLGSSPAMRRLYEALARVAATDASVLLTGESGTGKELAAQALHALSLRRDGPFVAVNCGAIAPHLVESEMFGHDRGSFTGADREHRGFFERAHGGTLFLDEITEMPADLQVKLLRVLETGQVTRVGACGDIEVDVRILAASNRDPAGAVESGALRADLYHRINVFPIAMPPLRERGEDIARLADSFLAALNQEHGGTVGFSDAARAALARHGWPGNVRELRNFVQRAWIFSEGGRIEVLPPPILEELAGMIQGTGNGVSVPLDTSLDELDRRLIVGTLAQCGGVKAHAAEVLDISLKTVYNRLAGHRRKLGEGH
ncbi:sigma-54-dependent transcriptional regulator [Burkholderia gladioli]|uniref:sigma-54-dependent transcriptional regulator n=1 Tax=Burkholderia gladioli TaxID=28095 RepID=UPI0005BC7207|nr:sigma-54 dependent transcriptional regulator [Burkholderia gladioli]